MKELKKIYKFFLKIISFIKNDGYIITDILQCLFGFLLCIFSLILAFSGIYGLFNYSEETIVSSLINLLFSFPMLFRIGYNLITADV